MERGRRGRYQPANIQRHVTRGSTEPGFQDSGMWEGAETHEISVQDPYFYSYSHYSIHEEMLKDTTRTETYMNAIIQNPALFRGKVVLDVGCGTGILSIFAARAGALHVYGVDAAEIAIYARMIVAENNLSSTITIIQGQVEQVELPVAKVDIIISEWMGYFLLYETMLETVLFARDKWLAPGGLMFPDTAAIFIAGIEDAEYREGKVDFWDNVYGLDMSVLKEAVITEPLVDNVEAGAICTEVACVHRLQLESVPKDQTHFVSRFRLAATRKDTVHALVAWFEVQFTHGTKPYLLSTSPRLRATHWKHTVFYIDRPVPLFEKEELYGSIAVRKNLEHPRELDIKISFHNDGKFPVHSIRLYRLK